MIRRKFAHAFAVLTLGLGVGFLTYFAVYNESRSNYVGTPGLHAGSTYNQRINELDFVSTISGFGAGLVAVSVATFVLIAKAGRAEVPKGPLPEV